MSQGQKKKSVYILMYPECIEFEVMLAAELCNRTHNVRVVTPDGKGHRGFSGIKIEADCALPGIILEGCAGILIPGGDPYDLIEGEIAPQIKKLLVDASEHNIVFGAICAGPAVLGKHGLLKTKRFTHGYGDAHKEALAPMWEGAQFTDTDLEVDGNLVTAKPGAHTEFATQFAMQIGAIESEAKRDQLTRYYKNSKPGTTPAYIDHTTMPVKDLARSKEFYERAFKPLGIKLAFGEEGVFWAFDLGCGLFEFRQAGEGESIGRTHIAIRVADHESVKKFHEAALEAGGKDNGGPGPRKEYTPNYYASFVLDPDGHNIEAMYDL
jgi:putative intracellular protease/amidase/catechol 2,3-dioxygenase-like lactoylglutathione lyase family enzyme